MARRKYEAGIKERRHKYTPRQRDSLPDRIVLNSSNADELAQSVRSYAAMIRESSENETVDCLLDELARSLSAGCTRSATILAWSAGISFLADQLWLAVGESANGWDGLINSAQSRIPSVQCGVDPRKLPRVGTDFDINLWQKNYSEPQIAFLGFAKGLYSAYALEQLYLDCFRPRCRAAHPSSTIIPIEDVARSLRLIAHYLLRSRG